MKKETKNFGNVFTIEEETLTDGSKVYNVKHISTNTAFDCVDYSHATKLFKELERCVAISIEGALITLHAQKKIDALRNQVSDLISQIGQADEVNALLRKKLADQKHAIQERDGAITFRDDAITRRHNIIVEKDKKIGNLKRGIKELSDRYQESQHKEINDKLREDRRRLKKAIAELSRRLHDEMMKTQTLKIHIKDRDNRIKKLMVRIIELSEVRGHWD